MPPIHRELIYSSYHVPCGNSRIEREDDVKILTWEARQKKNLTLRQLEKLSGINKTTLNCIENGKISPRLKQLEKVATALDIKVIDLFES